MKCTRLQSKTGLHCKTSEKAHGDSPPKLFWQQQTLHRNMHPFTFLSIILHKYKAFTLKAVYWQAFYRSVPESWQNVHNVMRFIESRSDDIVHTVWVMNDNLPTTVKTNEFQSICFGILSITVHETTPPTPARYINSTISYSGCYAGTGMVESLLWQKHFCLPKGQFRFVMKVGNLAWKVDWQGKIMPISCTDRL